MNLAVVKQLLTATIPGEICAVPDCNIYRIEKFSAQSQAAATSGKAVTAQTTHRFLVAYETNQCNEKT
jgi:hypothetical protein